MIHKRLNTIFLVTLAVLCSLLSFTATQAAASCVDVCENSRNFCYYDAGKWDFPLWVCDNAFDLCMEACPALEVDLQCGVGSSGFFICTADAYGGSEDYEYDWSVNGGVIGFNLGDTIYGTCGAIATMSVTVDDGYSTVSEDFTLSCLTNQY